MDAKNGDGIVNRFLWCWEQYTNAKETQADISQCLSACFITTD
jgi:hypothetical protein